MALVGDSHAAMWNPAFQQVAEQRHWRLEMLTKAACPLMDLSIASALPSLGEYIEHASSGAVKSSPGYAPSTRGWSWSACCGSTAVAQLVGFTSYDPAWIDSLTRLVQQLRGTGAKVLVLGPIPDPHSWCRSACPGTSMTRRPACRHGRRR